ncbi:MAG: hypothetical protein WAX89_02440 [Alphaproteobacteria bacterium]
MKMAKNKHKCITKVVRALALPVLCGTWLAPLTSFAAPVPGYVPPVTMTTTPDYADDTRGVFVPSHDQYRLMRDNELQAWGGRQADGGAQDPDMYERNLNVLSNGAASMGAEMDRISQDPGLLSGGAMTTDATQYAPLPQDEYAAQRMAQMAPVATPYTGYAGGQAANGYSAEYPAGMVSDPGAQPLGNAYAGAPVGDGGVEIVAGAPKAGAVVDMHNSLVRLREERISIRRALQRMMDQIGASDWAVVWDLDEQNAGLPEMEISIYAEEPFVNVLNALLARVQTRSGQPLRVIRYDETHRMVITDRAGGYRLQGQTAGVGAEETKGGSVAVTERVLKEALVSLHYDEIPLVDALENVVNQAGQGQWRLRMYAGRDQVLKPAHVEEPFNVAMERLLKLFGLKYEIFPGGKLVVVTHDGKFGYKGMEK